MEITSFFNSMNIDKGLLTNDLITDREKDKVFGTLALRCLGIVTLAAGITLGVIGTISLISGNVAGIPLMVTGLFLATLGHDVAVVGHNASRFQRNIVDDTTSIFDSLRVEVGNLIAGRAESFDIDRIAVRRNIQGTWLFRWFV